MSGNFITIEGMDGAGKSTLITRLTEALEASMPITTVYDPGVTKTGERLREIVKYGVEGEHLEPLSELAVFMSARHELTEKIIRPELEKGVTVISDRYQLSTDAYQGAGLGLTEAVESLKGVFKPITPNLTIILHLDYETAVSRATERDAGRADAIEARGEEYFKRIGTYFLESVQREDYCIVVDASMTPDEVFTECLDLILKYCNI
jgi:dTMP kinase